MAKSTPITLRLDTDLYKALQSTAKAEEIPVSYVIRRALRKGLNLPAPGVAQGLDAQADKLVESWE